MPIWGIYNGGGATAPTSGLPSGYAWASATSTSTTTTNTYFWLGTNSTATASATTWATIDNFANTMIQQYWENELNQSQYVALSRQRVGISQAHAAMTAERMAAQRAIGEQQRADAHLRYAEAERVREAAKAKSRELLLSHLTKEQRETFEKNHWFTVEGGKTQQLYRIRSTGISGNIDVLEGRPGKVTHRLCCHLRDVSVPLYDHILAQKVWIERDEEQFLRTANRHAA